MLRENASNEIERIAEIDIDRVLEGAESEGRLLDSLGAYVGAKVDEALDQFDSNDRTLVLFGSSLAMELVNLWVANRGLRLLVASGTCLRDPKDVPPKV